MKRLAILSTLLLSGCQAPAPVIVQAPSASEPVSVSPAAPAPVVVQSAQSSLPPVPQEIITRPMPTPAPRRVVAVPVAMPPVATRRSFAPVPEARAAAPMSTREAVRIIASKIRNATSANDLVLIEMDLERVQNGLGFDSKGMDEKIRISHLRNAARARENAIRAGVAGYDLTSEMSIEMALK